MSTREINRREFITKCSIKLSAASLFLSTYDAKPTFGEEKKSQPEKKKEPNMEYRTLGRTGLKVSVVSCGMAYLRERAVLFRALDLGINYFDTAHGYRGGNSERMLGEVLKKYGRKKVLIGTKIYPFHERYKSSKEFRLLERETLDDMMDESLKRLQTDYVDVFFVHRVPDKRCLSNGDLLAFLENLKKKGKARFVGVSLHDAGIFVDVVDFVLQPNIFDVLLAWLDFQSPPEHIDALKRARKANVGVIAMKTQAGGYETPSTRSLNPMQAALKWVVNQDYVDCTVPGMQNIEQLEENVGVVGKKMVWNDRKVLHAYSNDIKYHYCIMCGKCLSTCGNLVNITTINRALMYSEGHRNFEKGCETYRALSAEESGLSCGSCTSPTCKCAHRIKIAERMKLAHTLFA